ncbi:MAG: 4-hydroxy-tetrahydrodipicolinate reductase [Finegoldia sp.]|nr:4-hydroxy-tetrahydrodipicolinate reductase [Finegoldia sp.]
MIKILLTGATGAMGKTVASLCQEEENMEIVAGIGLDSTGDEGFKVYQNLGEVREEVDVVIDFSSTKLLDDILSFAKEKKTALVLATTGYSEEDFAKIEAFSKEVAIVQSGNMGVGINVIEKVVEELAKTLQGFDIEIVEKHHNKKKDAPSGTAEMLYKAADRGRGGSTHAVRGRAGMSEGRDENEIGIQAVRGGTITGEHDVIFAGLDEVITVSHHAQSKKIFATGALKAAEFLVDKEAGRYDMHDVLGI